LTLDPRAHKNHHPCMALARRSPALFALLLAASAGGCRRGARHARPVPPPSSPAAQLDAALAPGAVVDGLAAVLGAHVKASTRFAVSTDADEPARGKAGKDAPSRSDVTTLTEVWLDRDGHFRIVEDNDRDGGREIVRSGQELAVGLKYGKLIRRPAQDPEPRGYLEQALGSPWAVWELVRSGAVVSETPAQAAPTPRPARAFHLARDPSARAPGPPDEEDTRLRKWRQTAVVDELEGDVVLMPPAPGDAHPPALLALSAKGSFHASHEGKPVHGSFAVTFAADELAKVAAVAAPAAEPLPTLQRTSLEEKALLGDEPTSGETEKP
jgi:hypothetical protein